MAIHCSNLIKLINKKNFNNNFDCTNIRSESIKFITSGSIIAIDDDTRGKRYDRSCSFYLGIHRRGSEKEATKLRLASSFFFAIWVGWGHSIVSLAEYIVGSRDSIRHRRHRSRTVLTIFYQSRQKLLRESCTQMVSFFFFTIIR